MPIIEPWGQARVRRLSGFIVEQALNEVERRVLGVLIEKALSQPDYYPMTLNAVVTACSQRSNRDPVMNVDEDAVLGALEALRRRGLVTIVLPAPGARTNRYKHTAEAHFGWGKRQQAIMAELLLRGPQTPGELRSRCSRMFTLESLEAVSIALGSLSGGESDPPVVTAMPREPGRSTIRYRHLLYPAGEAPAAAAPATVRLQAAPSTGASPSAAAVSGAPSETDVEALRSEINDLNAEVADLHEELADLRRRLDLLENRHSTS